MSDYERSILLKKKNKKKNEETRRRYIMNGIFFFKKKADSLRIYMQLQGHERSDRRQGKRNLSIQASRRHPE